MTERRGGTGSGTADFEATYRAEVHGLTALARSLTGDREVAADLVHEAMVRTYRSWPHVASLDRPGAWIRRVLINLVIDAQRRRRRETGVLTRLAHTTTPTPAAPDDRLDADLDAGRFWAAVRELPERQRAAVALCYIDDLGIAEIAEVLEVSAGTVKTSLHRARRQLAAVLGPQLGRTIDTPPTPDEVTR